MIPQNQEDAAIQNQHKESHSARTKVMELISSKISENSEDKPNKFLESLQSKLSGNVLNKIRKSRNGHSSEVHVSA